MTLTDRRHLTELRKPFYLVDSGNVLPKFMTAVPAIAMAPPTHMELSMLSPSSKADKITPTTGTKVI